MKPIILVAGALMLAPFSSTAFAASPQAGWFVPQLTSGDTPECAPMLARVREQFADTDPWTSYAEQPLGEEVGGLQASAGGYVGEEKTRQATVGTRQIRIERVPGCGGACEGQTASVLADGNVVFTVPRATLWAEYSDGKARDYLVGFVGEVIEVYAVSGTKAPACRIALEPDFKTVNDMDVLAALKTVNDLDQASFGMSRGGGCGSARTTERWADFVRDALHQALYRPWALAPRGNPASANSYGDYDRIMPQLELWSLGGFSEQAALHLYKNRIAATEKLLTDFYVKRFGWQQPKAQSMAHSALVNAISSGFGFYMYKPFLDDDEIALRKALLRHAPMTDIQAIPLAVQTLEARPRDWGNFWTDSLLNVAVKYPQALKYLLDNGFDPNLANSFGKTPLMYAAQYNQFEAARLLLKAGADPNARTSHPPFDCGYSLSTTNVTPLHYAVRNAGTPLIRLLLQSGAETSIKAAYDDHRGHMQDETAVDWLNRYTNGEGEQNPNLTTRDAATLATELAPRVSR